MGDQGIISFFSRLFESSKRIILAPRSVPIPVIRQAPVKKSPRVLVAMAVFMYVKRGLLCFYRS